MKVQFFRSKLLKNFLIILLFLASQEVIAQLSVTFQVDMNAIQSEKPLEKVGIRGNLQPLSWEKTYPLNDQDGDGIFSGTIDFDTQNIGEKVEFKFVYGDVIWEFDGQANRKFTLKKDGVELPIFKWDELEITTPTTFTVAQLKEDFEIMKAAYLKIHPGLYRYNTLTSLEQHFSTLEKALSQELSLSEAYLAFSQFLAKIKCGHTYCNFFNQSAKVQQELFARSDYLPFTFQLINKRMVVEKNASKVEGLGAGTEITTINGVPTSTIIDRLMTLVKADGSSDNKRLQDLELTGLGQFESFDVYFPLFFKSKEGKYLLETYNHKNKKGKQITVEGVSRKQRQERMVKRYGPIPKTYDELWSFEILDPTTAYLKMGTFAAYKMELDWKKFLKKAFKAIEEQQIPNLIIDIRDNEGGNDEVSFELVQYLVKNEVRIKAFRELMRYEKIPEELAPYLKTWDNSFKDRTGKVKKVEDGFYTWKEGMGEDLVLPPSKKAFKGNTYLMINAGNSSATFTLARAMKEGGIATLVGQDTGGNRRGINGGQYLFLYLPNTQIEMDIPLIGYYPQTEEPDEGIKADIYVEPSIEDVANGIDTELEVVKQLIANKR